MGSSRLAAAVVALALIAGIGGWVIVTYLNPGPNPAPLPPASAGFVESADQAGLDFRMRFLPNEQGEKFKINLYDHGCGLAVADYDNDGHDDVYFVNQLGPNALYRNRGDGTFENTTVQAGVAVGDRICVSAAFVDYDNDGASDLYVVSTRGGNLLFRNLGNGKFAEVTAKAGLGYVGHSQAGAFFDYDNDGFLDLLLTNTAAWTTNEFDKVARYYLGKGEFGGVIESKKEANVFYRNNGNGAFTDVTAKVGLAGMGWAGDAVAFDYNDDGRQDVLVTSMFGRSQLYRNNPDGTFTDVTMKTLGRTSWGGLGAKVFDFNNDGRLDLYIVDMHSDMWMGLDAEHRSRPVARSAGRKKFRSVYGPLADEDPTVELQEQELARKVGFRHDEVVFGNVFFRNDGGGKFTELSDQAGLENFWPWGIASGDFDNDGFEDVFVPTGMGYPFYYWPNYLLMNQGNETFRDRAADLGIEPPVRGENLSEPIGGKPAPRSSRSAATADFDGDGRLEIVVNNFNDQPYLFRNRLAAKNWVALRLRGTPSNRDAIGAVVRVHQGQRVLTRQVAGIGGYLSQSSRTLHFGLGDAGAVERIEITWPSGVVQRLDGLAINRRHDIQELPRKGS